jgi:hypothetical protein
MLRTLLTSCVFLFVGLSMAISQDVDGYSKRILGKWLGSHSGTANIFHRRGSWGVQRDLEPETIQGRWWIKGNKLFLTYSEDNGVGTPVHIRTAEYAIMFESDDRFITETQGYKEIYERFR